MPKLKPGWQRVKFAQLAECVNDRVDDPSKAGVDRYVGLEHLDPESLAIRRWGTPDEVESTKLRFRPGDIIFGKRRAYQRKLAVADVEGICSAHAMVLRAKPGVVLPEFLPFFMQSDIFMERAQAISVGSLSPTINWKTLAAEEFTLPPLEEQGELAEAFVLAEENIGAARSQVECASLMKASLREHLVWNEGYRPIQLGQVASMQNGRAFPGEEYQKSGIKLLRPGNLHESGEFDWRPTRTVCMPTKYEEECERFIVEAGDLVMNLTAQSLDDGFMGRVCFARTGDKCLLNQRIGRIFPNRDVISGEYLFRVLQSIRFQAHAISMCEGTKVKHLFWHHLERFTFPLPTPDYQEEACCNLKEMDGGCALSDERVELARRLKTKLLNSLFVV